MPRPSIFALGVAAFAAGCTPTVNVATKEPIVIQVNIAHEVRVKIEDDVAGVMTQESAVATRGEDSLAWAKAAGDVGERADGYVGVVPGKETDARNALVDAENARRRAEYQRIAREHAVDVRTVEAVAGERRLRETPASEWVMDASGNWKQKA